MAQQKLLRLSEELAADIKAIAASRNISENQIIIEALTLFRDREYMQHKATFINDELIAVLQASYKMAENTINNKTCRVLSEVAIQASIQNQILSRSLEVSQSDLTKYRLRAVEFLKEHQHVLRLDKLQQEE